MQAWSQAARASAREAAGRGPAMLVGEHERVTRGADVGLQVLLDVGQQRRGDGDGAPTGLRLRPDDHQRAVIKPLEVLGDLHLAVQQVEVSSGERRQLAEGQ